jgi:8-oxo-dGTP pyrophosphatase MutT (NUDIX family)
MSKHPGEIAFPGGRVDPEDSGLIGTATRELQEELGIQPHLVEILGHLLPQQTLTSGFIIYPVVGKLDQKTVCTPNPEEVDEVLEIPIDDLLLPDAQRWSRFDLPEGTIRSPYYPWEGRTIWGATGRILADLLNLLA